MRRAIQWFESITKTTQAVRDGRNQLAARPEARKRTENERLHLRNMFNDLKCSNNIEAPSVAFGVLSQINAMGG
ncbi:MAG: hypothetical protein ABFS45_08875 [Pseudomonadota bacterium]